MTGLGDEDVGAARVEDVVVVAVGALDGQSRSARAGSKGWRRERELAAGGREGGRGRMGLACVMISWPSSKSLSWKASMSVVLRWLSVFGIGRLWFAHSQAKDVRIILWLEERMFMCKERRKST